jgi:hypothetical protein
MNFAYAVAAALLTVLCWGMYGPVLHQGQSAMGEKTEAGFAPSRLRPLLCVGLAYFAIAVVVPIVLLNTVGEAGRWTFTGTVWSFGAGAAGAIGALGIVLALSFGGSPYWVMPLVFGCAPIVSVFSTRLLTHSSTPITPWFLAGLIIVSIGAVMTLVFAPTGHGPTKTAANATTQAK